MNARCGPVALVLGCALGVACGESVPPVPDVRTIEVPAVADPDIAGAIAQARREIELDPDSPAAWSELAELLHAHDLAAPAAKAYQAAARLDPENPDWPYLEGQLALHQGDVSRAAVCLERARSLAPHDALVAAFAARALVLAGELDRARAVALEATALDPELALGHAVLGEAQQALGATAQAVAAFSRAAALQPEATRLFHQLASLARRQGEEAAADRFARLAGDRAVVADDPRLRRVVARARGLEATIEAATVAFTEGRFEMAEDLWRLVTTKEPSLAKGWIGLGSSLVRLGRVGEATEAFEQALALAPRDALVHFNLGVLAARRGDDLAAITFATTAVEIDPAAHDARFNLANALRRQNRDLEAVPHYRRIVAAQPTRAPAWQALAAALARVGRWAEALEVVEQGLTHAPRDGGLHLAKIRALATAPDPVVRDPEAALAWASRLGAARENPLVLEAIALAHANLGQWSEARVLVERAVTRANQHGALDARVRDRLVRTRAEIAQGRPLAGAPLD